MRIRNIITKLNIEIEGMVDKYDSIIELVLNWTFEESKSCAIFNKLLCHISILWDTNIIDYVLPWICNFDLQTVSKSLLFCIRSLDDPQGISKMGDIPLQEKSLVSICCGVAVDNIVSQRRPQSIKLSDSVDTNPLLFPQTLQKVAKFTYQWILQFEETFDDDPYDLHQCRKSLIDSLYKLRQLAYLDMITMRIL